MGIFDFIRNAGNKVLRKDKDGETTAPETSQAAVA